MMTRAQLNNSICEKSYLKVVLLRRPLASNIESAEGEEL